MLGKERITDEVEVLIKREFRYFSRGFMCVCKSHRSLRFTQTHPFRSHDHEKKKKKKRKKAKYPSAEIA